MKTSQIVLNLFIAAVLAAALLAFPAPAYADATITVTGTADSDSMAVLNGNTTCDLREAVQAANTNAAVGQCIAGTAGVDTINFNIGGAVSLKQINLVDILYLSGTFVLDGTTQPGYVAGDQPKIRLDGGGTVDWGLSVTDADNGGIKGLMLTGFEFDAIKLSSTNTFSILANYIGTDGVSDLTDSYYGIYLYDSQNVTIGGLGTDRNLIAGHMYSGIVLAGGSTTGSDNNQIFGNYIGVAANGMTAIPSQNYGVDLVLGDGAGASYNVVIGNLIAGHDTGVYNHSNLNDYNTITGNLIGTNMAGTAALGNATGIHIHGGDGINITFNLISGNTTGIYLAGTPTNTSIHDNQIGTTQNGLGALPNTDYGIRLNGVPAKIGDGTTPGNNVISGNAYAGIYLSGAGTSGTTIIGNKIGPDVEGSAFLGNGSGTNEGGIIVTGSASVQLADNWIASNNANGLLAYTGGTLAAGSDGNCFTGNTGYGAKNTSPGGTLLLENNWWDDGTGPHHSVNYPSGLGEEVSGGVDAAPFLRVPPAICSALQASGFLSYGQRLVGTSMLKTVTLTNVGSASVTITGLSTSAPFSVTSAGTCGPLPRTLGVGAACSVVVKFVPTASGPVKRNLVVASDAVGSPLRVLLTGSGVAGTQLLKNTSFETDANADNKPDDWSYTGYSASTDARDCTVFKLGACSLRLAGSAQLKTIKQVILKSGSAGDDFAFSLWSKGSAVPAGSIYRLQVLFYNGSTLISVKTMNFASGTHDFAKVGGCFTAPGSYTKIIFKIDFNASAGTAWFDGASLKWAP